MKDPINPISRATIERARDERDIKPSYRAEGLTTAQSDDRHAAYQREANAWNDLVAARRAYDQGCGQVSAAVLEVALDRFREAARECRRGR